MPGSSEKPEVTIERNNFREYLEPLADLDAACFQQDGWGQDAFSGLFLYRNLRVYAIARASCMIAYLAATGVQQEAELLRIGVRSDFRRQAYGTALLSRLIRDLVAGGFSTLWLEVRRDNLAACRFYTHNRFVLSGERKGYYRSPTCDALVFNLKLRP